MSLIIVIRLFLLFPFLFPGHPDLAFPPGVYLRCLEVDFPVSRSVETGLLLKGEQGNPLSVPCQEIAYQGGCRGATIACLQLSGECSRLFGSDTTIVQSIIFFVDEEFDKSFSMVPALSFSSPVRSPDIRTSLIFSLTLFFLMALLVRRCRLLVGIGHRDAPLGKAASRCFPFPCSVRRHGTARHILARFPELAVGYIQSFHAVGVRWTG